MLRQRWTLLSAELLRVAWTDSVSKAVARIKSRLHQSGELVEDFDVAITAHALAWDLCLVSNNTRYMARVRGLRLKDWTAE